MESERVRTPKTMPTPSTMPTTVSRVRCTLARRFRKLSPAKRLSFTLPWPSTGRDTRRRWCCACTRCPAGRTLVERRHGECEAVRRETFSGELQAGEEILHTEPLSGEVRPHTQSHVDRLARPLELEEADEDSVFVEDREVGILPALRVE